MSSQFSLASASVTRGNSFKIIYLKCHYDLSKYLFCNRVTNLFNSLPNAVLAAQSLK